jgi:hypothetical protein
MVQVTRPAPTIQIPPLPTGEPGPAAVPPSPDDIAALGLAEIPSLASSASRPLFLSAQAPAAGGQGAPAPDTRQAPSAAAKQLSTRLTLVGVVDGESPQVILEDSQGQKTFFVTIGQVTVEGAVLEQVQGNRVILDLQGEKIELSM